MKLIKCLVEDIEEELEGAEHYIKAQKASGYEAPASMQAVWDWEHDKMVDTTARVKTMLSMYRGF